MNIRKVITVASFVLMCIGTPPLVAREVLSVRTEGRVATFSIDHILRQFHGDITADDMKNIAGLIEAEYRRRGYSLAVVGRMEIDNDSVLVIYIHEPLLEGVVVRGVKEKTARDLEGFLVPSRDESYNRKVLRQRLARAKKIFALKEIRAGVEVTDSGNVFIVVDAEKKKGSFYGGVGSDLFYGLSPMLGYYHPFESTALDTRVSVGIDKDGFRRADGLLAFYYFGDDFSSAFFTELSSSMKIDAWEARQEEYRTVDLTPAFGYMLDRGIGQYRFYGSETVMWISDYGDAGKGTAFDTRINASVALGNRGKTGSARRSWSAELESGAGYETFTDSLYADATLTGRYPVFPIRWLCLAPRFYGFYTSSTERLWLRYAYNEYLLGFFEDYTAAQLINTAGLDIDFEVARDYLFLGPFVHGSAFRDELHSWRFKSGTGLRLTAEYESVTLLVVYAWDITKSPNKGGVYFSLSGSL